MGHTSDRTLDHIVLAIMRRDTRLVMVRQYVPVAHRSYWVLPGGLVEPGELLSDALVREVREETGTILDELGPLVCISQIDRPARKAQTVAFVFEVARWRGELHPQDPDGEVQRAELIPQAMAMSRLAQNGAWPGIQTPLLAYLRGEAPRGTIWFYREKGGTQSLIGRAPESE